MSLIVTLEVNIINKQKFLAELSRLLTFMYEEDRAEAITMYEGLFDEANDEQALLQLLMSPTRQAVVIARTYDAKERKLQVYAQSREEEEASDELPPFIRSICEIREEAVSRGLIAQGAPVDQFSLFQDAYEPENVYLPEGEAPETAPAPETEPAPDEVDAFISDFSIPDGLLPEDVLKAEAALDVENSPDLVAEQNSIEEDCAPLRVKRKAKVGLLIPYILLAVPIAFLGIVLLFIPALLSLGLSAACIGMGILTVSAAFTSFIYLADILVVFGIAVILLALGLLFMWLFIWFIVGVMTSLVSGIISLGRKWCCKEVPVNE